MVSDEEALDVEHLQDLVQQQGDTVRALKAAESPNQDEISRAIEKLKQLKIDLNAEITRRKESGDLLIKSKEDFRQKVANSLESRLFYIPSFKIYGGVGGLYDYGESSLVFAARARARLLNTFVMMFLFAILSRRAAVRWTASFFRARVWDSLTFRRHILTLTIPLHFTL
jgi:glycyl-tRNA synthetase